MAERIKAADDADVISRRLKELACWRERKCFTNNGLSVNDCWCFQARVTESGNTVSIPCSEASDKQPVAA